MNLDDIREGSLITGLVDGQVVEVCFVKRRGPDDLTVFYKVPGQGKIDECVLSRQDQKRLSEATTARLWSFDAPGDDFKLAVEAWRISLAHLFDPMMAIHTSDVEPLPHQISAVYEAMLPRQPLRFLLADDPGAGKTIMAGLLIRELLMRADVRRILIVAPGSLVVQWQDEMSKKFDLDFKLFTTEMHESSTSGNPFDDHDQLIARIDHLKLNEELLAKIDRTHWDLVVIDEAHKLSVRAFGKKVEKSMRFKLAERLAKNTRHFLLMTATPHNGKEDDFQHFMSLLDEDRFFGTSRRKAKKVDVGDLMRRMVKEQLKNFDGTPLFRERVAQTVQFTLSPLENRLYEAVTDYVKNEMSRADAIENGTRKHNVGFALTSLQRRLASSPAAIFESIKRRREKLKNLLAEERAANTQRLSDESLKFMDRQEAWDADEDSPSDEYEILEQELVDKATAAQTVEQLEAEIVVLDDLLMQAQQVVASGVDRKWDELSRLLSDPSMLNENGTHRKLIIFTEHKDTLRYLSGKIREELGRDAAVVHIDGSVSRDGRLEVQAKFWNDPETLILIATDAAGEGVNLQCANLMVNYDLPWNPNRIEQRFGRIHRIGQREICYLWNMVAEGTREGDVFNCLLQKLDRVRAALGDQVFDVLGEMFENISLRDLLIEAIRYGADPQRKEELLEEVESVLDIAQIREMISKNALCDMVMGQEDLFRIKADMEKAEARKLQPYFVRSFFEHAFDKLGGTVIMGEEGRLEITKVPSTIIENAKASASKKREAPIQKRYSRVCFDKKLVQIDKPGAPAATLLHPGHPLMKSIIRLIQDNHHRKLRQGATFVAPMDSSITPKVLLILEHVIKESSGKEREVSRRIQFVEITQDGQAEDAGWAPHLDLEPISPEERGLVKDVLAAAWIGPTLEAKAISYATANIVPKHQKEIQSQREQHIDKTLAAVNERLDREIKYQADRVMQLQEDIANGRDVRLPLDNAVNVINDLRARWAAREKELRAMRHLSSKEPTLIGTALVIPAGLMNMRRGKPSADASERQRIERIAMQAVMDAERNKGRQVFDVSAEKCGWDITSIDLSEDGIPTVTRHIEVKGRAKGQDSITITRNEILYALNQREKFQLAVVFVDGDSYEGPHYIEDPFGDDISWAETSRNFSFDKLYGSVH